MGIIKGAIDFTGKVGNLVAYKRNGKTVIQGKGGASKKRIYNDASLKGIKDNAFGFRNAVNVGVNLRKGIDFSNCAPESVHSKLQGFLFGEVVRRDGVNPPGEWRVLPENLNVLNTYRFNAQIPSLVHDAMMQAVWLKSADGIHMKLELPDFDILKENFHGFKIWGGVRIISLVEKGLYDSYEAETEMFESGSRGEVAFDFPPLEIEGDESNRLGDDEIAVVYHWGFHTFIDGLPMNNRSMNGVFMRVAES